MKKSIFITILAFIMTTTTFAQQADSKAIKETITAFSAAGDASNADQVANYLDDSFRVVMNRLFGSTEVSLMPKAVYVEKIRTKEFGGDTRKVTIKNVVVNGSSASAQVTYEGTKMTFVTVTTLLKDAEGSWKLVSEIPMIL